jgi:RNA polymerase sigma-70 factor, ECF subfamily
LNEKRPRVMARGRFGVVRSAIRRKDFFTSGIGHKMLYDSSTYPVQDPERATAQDQIRIVLERAINGLPETFRTVFVMREVEGLSTQETASALGILPQTVKTRLHRARRLLREALGEQVRANLKDIFPFEGPRCDRLISRLLDQLGLPDLPRNLLVTRREAPA